MSRLLTVLPTHPESAGKTALAEATEKGFEEIAGIIGAAPAEGEEGPAEGDGEEAAEGGGEEGEEGAEGEEEEES